MLENNIFDLDSLVKAYNDQFEKTMELNGWDNTEEGELKRKKYDSAWREWDEKMIENLNLKTYLGESIFKDLLFCLDNDNSNHGLSFYALVKEVEDECLLLEKRETIDFINNLKHSIEFRKESYYVDLRFKTSIKEHFYAGGFLKHNEEMRAEEGAELLEEIMGEEDGFMPGLSKAIEGLMQKEDFISDYFEFGSKDFGLYWNIRISAFDSFIDKFLAWIKYEELGDYFLYYSVYDKALDQFTTYDINKIKIEHKNED